MSQFHLDEDVNPRIAAALIVAGHGAVTARQLGMLAAPDGAHLLSTLLHQRILITRNRKDFLLLHDAWKRWAAAWQTWYLAFFLPGTTPPLLQHGGVLIIPQAWSPARAAQEIDQFVQQHPAFPGELYAWEQSGGWTRH